MPIDASIISQAQNIPQIRYQPESQFESFAKIQPTLNAMQQMKQRAVAARGAAEIEDFIRKSGHNINLGQLGSLLVRVGKVEEGTQLLIADSNRRKLEAELGSMEFGNQAAAPTGANAMVPAPTANAMAQPAAGQPSVPSPAVTAPPMPATAPSMAPQGQPTGFRPTPQQLARMAAIDDVGARVAGVLAPFAEKPQPVPEKIRMMRQLGFPETQEGYRQFEEFGRAPQDTRTSDIKNYKEALEGGFQGSFYDFLTGLRKAGSPVSTVKVDAFVPASEQAQADFIKEASNTRKALANAADTIKNVVAAKALIPSASTFMGTGGEPLLAAASFFNNRLGFSIATQGITDATELNTRLFEGILDNLKKLDSNPSTEQQRVLREALGSLGTDPSALPRILDRIEETMRDRVARYNQDVTEAEKRGVKFPYRPQIDLPPAKSSAATGAAMYARNPKTGERIMSVDGGNTWTPAR
jgi:hypothetical protein